jgi:hypothetical protein
VALDAESPKRVAVHSGTAAAELVVGSERRWHRLPVSGPPVDIVNNVGSVLIEGGYGADRGYLEPDEGQYDAPADVFAWCGGSVLLRPAYLADVGLFDERFFLYYEDTDLSWRGRSRGWRYRYVPAAVARHIHAARRGGLAGLPALRGAQTGCSCWPRTRLRPHGRPRRLALPADHAVLRPARPGGPDAGAPAAPAHHRGAAGCARWRDFARLPPGILGRAAAGAAAGHGGRRRAAGVGGAAVNIGLRRLLADGRRRGEVRSGHRRSPGWRP